MVDPLKKYLDLGADIDPSDLTPVVNLSTMGEKINSLVALAVKLNTEQSHLAHNVALLDDAVRQGHACVQSDTIQTMEHLVRSNVANSIRAEERLEAIEKQNNRSRDVRWKLITFSMGLFAVIISSIGGGIWWLSDIGTRVNEHSISVRTNRESLEAMRRQMTKQTQLMEQTTERLNMLGQTTESLRDELVLAKRRRGRHGR